MLNDERLYQFAKESNEIERIYDERRHLNHAAALEKFLALKEIKIPNLETFVWSIEPTAFLRTRANDRVWIGGHEALDPLHVTKALAQLLVDINHPTITERANDRHKRYENIHPFIDGNGRSGRALWLWDMVRREGYDGRFKFLQMYYYLSLS